MGISNVASNLRPGICTSSTRPTTPYEGQVIYETDTDRTSVWDGSSWVEMARSSRAGLVQVVPTAVTNGTVDTYGNVTVGTGVSLVTMTNAFIPAFNNYRVVISGINFSAGQNSFWLKLENSLSTYTYSLKYALWAGTTVGVYVGTSNNGAWAGWSHWSNNVGNSVVDIINPNLARYTSFMAENSSEELWGTAHSIMKTATAYNDLLLNFPVGTMTGGTVRIYGYNQ